MGTFKADNNYYFSLLLEYPDFIIDGVAQARCMHSDAASTLQSLSHSSLDDRALISKLLGNVAFLEYQKKRLGTADSSVCVEKAKVCLANLGFVLNEASPDDCFYDQLHVS